MNHRNVMTYDLATSSISMVSRYSKIRRLSVPQAMVRAVHSLPPFSHPDEFYSKGDTCHGSVASSSSSASPAPSCQALSSSQPLGSL